MRDFEEITEEYKSARPGGVIYLGEISPQAFFNAFIEPEELPHLSRQEMMEDFFKPEVDEDNATFAANREEIAPDAINHPVHYVNGPACPHCGNTIECITVTEEMGFCLGNVVKYIWRRNLKGDTLKDLKKARWYLDREIQRMEARCER